MPKKLYIILILLAGVFWGTSPFFVSEMTACGFDSLQNTAIRIIIAAPLMHIALLASGRKHYKIPKKAFIYLALSGVCSVLAMCICYYYAMSMTSAAVSAVLLYSAPIFVMIMSVIFFKEKFTAKKTVCLILAVGGIALTSGIIGGLQGSPVGILVGLCSGIAYSLYGIFSTYALRMGVSPLACTTFSFTFAAIASLFITNPFTLVKDFILAPSPAFLIFFAVLFSACTSVIPYVLYTVGLTHVKPDVAAIAASTEPVVCALIGVFWLKQDITVFQIIGIAAVISAIIILNLKTKNKESENI